MKFPLASSPLFSLGTLGSVHSLAIPAEFNLQLCHFQERASLSQTKQHNSAFGKRQGTWNPPANLITSLQDVRSRVPSLLEYHQPKLTHSGLRPRNEHLP